MQKPTSPLTVRGRDRLARLEAIEKLLTRVNPPPPRSTEIVERISKQYGVSKRIAYRDLETVFHRWAEARSTSRAAMVRRAEHEWERREALADADGDVQAGNYALRERHRLLGLYAPTKLEHSGSIGVEVSGGLDLRVDAIIGVLDPAGLAALDVVLGQLERAKAAGMLPEPQDEPDGDDSGGPGSEAPSPAEVLPARPSKTARGGRKSEAVASRSRKSKG